ncbi:MAG: rhodanese-like domain-containing protein [Acidobacteriota bacterium]|nr:rhodanese-like domain-containing protein [Acidobacteriota bacterium]
MNYETITPMEAAARLERGEQFDFIDVREPEEYELARVEAARLLPLSRFNEWVGTLEPEVEIVVMCHHGVRSAQVCQFLARQGFAKLHNLAGGIERWSREVDHNVPRY